MKKSFYFFLLAFVSISYWGATPEESAASPNEITAVSVSYSQLPRNLQFFARDVNDSANVIFSGTVLTSGYDSIYLETYKNNILWKRKSQKLTYLAGTSQFSLGQNIHSELSEYKFKLFVKLGAVSTWLKTADSIVCGDVYIICGQSNAHPTDYRASYKNEFCRSFGIQTANYNGNNYNPADTSWGLSRADGASGSWSGPYNVGVWGLRLQRLIKENFGIPTCVINGGRAGSTIDMNLRNEFNQTDLTSVYGKLLYRVIKSGLAGKVKAIFWYQGESDGTVNWINYESKFDILYNSWKSNYPGFRKLFLFQTRPCCSEEYAGSLREVQRKLPLKYSDTELFSTVGAPNYGGCHFSFAGYENIADMVFRPVSSCFYAPIDTVNMRPPNVRAVYYTNALKKEIRVLFSNSSISYWPSDTLGQSMKNYFFLNGVYGNVSSGSISGDTLKLQLWNPSSASKLTYLPTVWDHSDTVVYEGPFLRNPKGIGALSFSDFPISNYPPTQLDLTVAIQGYYNPEFNRLNILDTLQVYLRSASFPYSIIDSARSVIDSLTFKGRFVFYNLPSGNYYIVVKGRNCMETWSKSGGAAFAQGMTTAYNFTTSLLQAYGSNLKLSGSKYCIYSSDINDDGLVDASDVISIFNDVFYFLNGYVVSDLNGDRIVDISDLNISFNNSFYFVSEIRP